MSLEDQVVCEAVAVDSGRLKKEAQLCSEAGSRER